MVNVEWKKRAVAVQKISSSIPSRGGHKNLYRHRELSKGSVSILLNTRYKAKNSTFENLLFLFESLVLVL